LILLKTHARLSSASIKMAFHGIRFFLRYTLDRDRDGLPCMRFRAESALSDVLTIHEVRRLVEAEPALHHRTFFWAVYSLGLRLQEALHLQPGHIDVARRLVHVHRGKGAVDRYVPLPSRTLELLDTYASTHRNHVWYFPGQPHKRDLAAVAPSPMDRRTVQCAIRRVVRRLGFKKRISIHTLRHSYATHLLEAGVSLRLIQQYLGHRSLNSTIRYLHFTTRGQEYAFDVVETLMS
jgi:integrase/recombinase XerD